MSDQIEGMPTGSESDWRLIKNIQGWAVSVQFVASEQAAGRKYLTPEWLQQVGARIDRAAAILLERQAAIEQVIDAASGYVIGGHTGGGRQALSDALCDLRKQRDA